MCIDGRVVAGRVKITSRCKIVTVDQNQGEFSDGEPLQTLRRLVEWAGWGVRCVSRVGH